MLQEAVMMPSYLRDGPKLATASGVIMRGKWLQKKRPAILEFNGILAMHFPQIHTKKKTKLDQQKAAKCIDIDTF